MRYGFGFIVVLGLVALLSGEAQARDRFSISVGFGSGRCWSPPGNVSFSYSSGGYCRPVYRERTCYPARVYYAPPVYYSEPVYCPPPVVVYEPAPAYYPQTRVIYRSTVVEEAVPCREPEVIVRPSYGGWDSYRSTTYYYGR